MRGGGEGGGRGEGEGRGEREVRGEGEERGRGSEIESMHHTCNSVQRLGSSWHKIACLDSALGRYD